jgi:hypothetical protein
MNKVTYNKKKSYMKLNDENRKQPPKSAYGVKIPTIRNFTSVFACAIVYILFLRSNSRMEPTFITALEKWYVLYTSF